MTKNKKSLFVNLARLNIKFIVLFINQFSKPIKFNHQFCAIL